jgi:hypothetical protein
VQLSAVANVSPLSVNIDPNAPARVVSEPQNRWLPNIVLNLKNSSSIIFCKYDSSSPRAVNLNRITPGVKAQPKQFRTQGNAEQIKQPDAKPENA